MIIEKFRLRASVTKDMVLRDERTVRTLRGRVCPLARAISVATIQRGGLGDLIAYVGQGSVHLYEIGDGVPKWEALLSGVATEFVEEVDNLPMNYGETYGNWDGHTFLFDFYGCTDLHHSIFNINHHLCGKPLSCTGKEPV